MKCGERRGLYSVLVDKSEGMRPLERPRCCRGDNNKLDLQEVGFWGMDWIELAQDKDRGGHIYCSNDSSCSIIWGNFLTS